MLCMPNQQDIWTTISISKDTAKRITELARLVTTKEGRFTKCSKHEAIHLAVMDMITRLKKKPR